MVGASPPVLLLIGDLALEISDAYWKWIHALNCTGNDDPDSLTA